MRRIAAWALAAGAAAVASAAPPAPPHELSAAQILEKNAEARGGAQAWRKIDTMVWVGHAESANAQASKVPFMLEQKRPNKTRFEIIADKQKSVRVFDGTNGWKLRLTSGGRPELQSYTIEEMNFARSAQVIDGPLLDYAAKGVTVALAGVEEVEGRKAYRLDVRLSSGLRQRAWIDAETFLDVRWEREAHNASGRSATVRMHYRNYHSFDGLQIPLTIETVTVSGSATDRLLIDKIALNPPLAERDFAKPSMPGGRRNAVAVDTRAPPPVARQTQHAAP